MVGAYRYLGMGMWVVGTPPRAAGVKIEDPRP